MELPRTFGKYQLLERIATGGMAEVFLARSFGVEGFEKRLVIKRILPQLARSPHFIKLFVREAKISALLNHPNVVSVFELGRVDADHYIAMEHIHGRDLTRAVRRRRAKGMGLPLPVAVYVAAGIARGLAFAHGYVDAEGRCEPIVHRDVSPHNVLLSFQGEVKLVDFGIARLMNELEAEPTGQPGGGKFAYMSPEQACGERIDHRSDIFSCGIVLYELLVNHRLFQDPDPQEKLRQVREAIVPDPRIEVPEIPERLWEILRKALARDPDDRYDDALLLEEDLRAFLFEAGHRVDSAALGAFLRDLFADELGPDPSAALLQKLANELIRAEASLDHTHTEHTASESTHSTRTGSRRIGEKKAVAVLVAEIVGLTDASEVIEPEEVVRQQDAVMRSVHRTSERFGGWVDEPRHDMITLLFGIPRAHEDDLDRAISCALDLLKAVERLRRRGQAVELAIGIHKGEVALSGTVEEPSYIPRGNVVKLARRLASLAEPGEIRVSDLVASQAGDRWRFELGPQVRMKGRREELATFLFAGRRRNARGGPGGRWIRRGDELETLAVAVTGLAEGRGGVLSISGDAGTGKTRLVRELREQAQRARVPCFLSRCYPYQNERPLAPFRDVVAAVLGIEPDDPAELIRTRLQSLSELGISAADIATLGEFFALQREGRLQPTREDIYGAGAAFVQGVARQRPALMVLEDLQYMQAFERGLLGHVIRASAGLRILWILTWRGRRAPAELPGPTEEIVLGTLDAHARAQLAADVLAARGVEEDLQAFIDQHATGNPLYVVELVKALQKKGHIHIQGRQAHLVEPSGELLLPPTLEGLVTSRVDALEPAAKGALQIASTIGVSFSPALVAEAAGLDEPGPLFRDLLESGLITPEDKEARRYAFASHLVWQVVRRSILGVQLRDHHRMVAEGMLRLFSDNLPPLYDSLSGHFAAAGELVSAARYVNLAGDLHRRGAFLERALRCYERGVEWLEKSADATGETNLRGESMLRMKAGEIGDLLGDHRSAEHHLQVALELAAEGACGDLEVRCYLALGRVFASTGRIVLARASLEQGLAEARINGDAPATAELLASLAQLASRGGDYETAEAYLVEALERAGDDPRAQATAHIGMGTRYIRDDLAERAWEHLELARELAESTGDRILQGRAYNNLGIARMALGDLPMSLELFRKALDVRRGTGYRNGLAVNLHNIGDAHLRLGRLGRAHAAFLESRDVARQAGLDRSVALNDIYLGYLAALREDSGAGLGQLRRATLAAARFGDEEAAVRGQWLEGRALRKIGREQEASQALQTALSDAHRIGATWVARDIEQELL
ncbi:MAG: protein kinase [Proteobacteria bacterium]|nr:protein kinase [Pseudomonadota bacterium]MCP4915459.1 protein kinase [Pseudomonadota bacterium]